MENDALPSLILVKQILNPVTSVTTFILIALIHGYEFEGDLIVMSVILFFLVAHLMDQDFLDYHKSWKGGLKWFIGFWFNTLSWFFLRWFIVVAFIVTVAFLAKLDNNYSPELLLDWLIGPPLLMASLQIIVKFLFFIAQQAKANSCSAVIVGINDIGLKLDNFLAQNSVSGMNIQGFFDDRERDVLANKSKHLGKMVDLASYIKKNLVNRVYITIPLSTQPRITQLLDELRDTTASIYFVPDVFLFDLIQARINAINGIPVITLCETPFSGINGFIKRTSDIIIASLILLLVSPIMFLIALGVKLSSKGPVFFKQRRYGLDGGEIIVYKFRSMKVCEDGAIIQQATQNDPRVTRFGAFLRKSSLDELPQFINVLQGRMSIVGPRPHAVAHNEMYRKLITGYMVRHKVKPGITGWAQVNGYRGETDCIEKMQGRIEYDLEYLRNWTLALDIMIILRTILIVLNDKQAY